MMRISAISRCATSLLAMAVFATSALVPAEVARAHAAAPAQPDPPPPDPPPDDPGCNPAGDPVSAYSGKWHHQQTDLVVNGVFPIRMVRRYDSQSVYDSPVGYGWSFTYDHRLFKYPDGSIVVRRNCGEKLEFAPVGGGYSRIPGTRGSLADAGISEHVLNYPDGSRYEFDVEGRLEAIQDSAGNRLEMTYDARGKLPLTGTSPASVDPTTPMVVAYPYRLTRIAERTSDGVLTGRHVDLAYDEATGRLSSITGNDGRSVTYQHEVHAGTGSTTGNLIQVNGLEGTVSTYTYADPQDPHDVTGYDTGELSLINVYDSAGRVIQQQLGGTTIDLSYTVTPAPQTIEVRKSRDSLGNLLYSRTTIYDFDFEGYTTKITDGLGNEFVYVLNAQKQVTRFEIWENTGTLAQPALQLLRALDSTYDTEGRLTSTTADLSSGETVSQQWEYDQGSVSAITRSSDGGGSVAAHSYRTEWSYHPDQGDQRGRVAVKTWGAGTSEARSNSYTYVDGKPESVTFPDGHKVVRTYYSSTDPQIGRRGMLHEVHHEVGGAPDPHRKIAYDYDSRGFTKAITDAEGNVTQYVYDDLGRLERMTLPNGEESIATYSAADGVSPGELIRQVEVGRTVADGEGRVSRYVYNASGHLTGYQVKNGASFDTVFTMDVDSDGRPHTITDADGLSRFATYDEIGRRVTSTDSLGRTYRRSYDPEGRVVSIEDPLLRDQRFAYDELGRMTQTSLTDGGSTTVTGSYLYDAVGNVLRVTDANGNSVDYAYDALKQLKQVQLVGETTQYSYDSRGRIDFILNGAGNKIDFSHDPWSDLDKIEIFATSSSPSPSRTFTYSHDLNGNLTAVSDSGIAGGSVYTSTYDALDRPDRVTAHYIPGGARTIDYDFNRFGELGAVTLEDGGSSLVHSYATNAFGRLTGASFPDGAGGQRDLTFGMSAAGRVDQILRPNGVAAGITYEGDGRVDVISVTGPPGALETYSYDYDPLGRIESFVDGSQAHSFGYDSLSRVTSATHAAGSGLPASESFSYDPGGNRENPADFAEYDYGANNRLLSVGSTTFGYDGEGNVTSKSTGHLFPHDELNRLVGYSITGTSASYAHDPMGRRIKKTVNGQETYFLWAGGLLLAEYDASGNRTAHYAYAGGFTPLQVNLGGEIYDVHANLLGAPKALSSAAGEVSWRANYTAYGESVVDSDADGDGQPVTFNLRLPGQYYDAESGLHYNMHRSYDPQVGRYLEKDPIGQAGGLNLYAYAGGDPINFADPTGTTTIYPPGFPPPGSPPGGGDPGGCSFPGADCGGDPPPPPPPPCPPKGDPPTSPPDGDPPGGPPDDGGPDDGAPDGNPGEGNRGDPPETSVPIPITPPGDPLGPPDVPAPPDAPPPPEPPEPPVPDPEDDGFVPDELDLGLDNPVAKGIKEAEVAFAYWAPIGLGISTIGLGTMVAFGVGTVACPLCGAAIIGIGALEIWLGSQTIGQLGDRWSGGGR